MIEKNALLEYLESNNLSIFWIAFGEKQILGDLEEDSYDECYFYGLYDKENRGTLKKWQRTGN